MWEVAAVALIPPGFLDSVVAIGKKHSGGGEAKIDWVATGFIYGYYSEEDDSHYIYLVSNRHVFQGAEKVFLRFNPKSGDQSARNFSIALVGQNGEQLWCSHPDPSVDVAVRGLNYHVLDEEGMQYGFFSGRDHAIRLDRLDELGVTEGDFVYVLGYPMGLVGSTRNAVIVRSGSIASIRGLLGRIEKACLVDSFVFPGNSGGPVILKPEFVSVRGTKAQTKALLIGIISAYVPYREGAFSAQTGELRVMFVENSGLAVVHPVDCIEEVIVEHLRIAKSAEKLNPGSSVP